jgi:hypothetical protein
MSRNSHKCISKAYFRINPNFMPIKYDMNIRTQRDHVVETTDMAKSDITLLKSVSRSMISAFELPILLHPLFQCQLSECCKTKNERTSFRYACGKIWVQSMSTGIASP